MNHNKSRWTKHLDFILLDIIVFHLSFVLAYTIQFGLSMNPYMSRSWRNIAIVMTVFDIVIVFLGSMLEKVLHRGHLKELSSLVKQTLLLELLTSFYLYLIHEGQAYSRMVVLLTGIIFVVLNLVVRILWKKILHRTLQHKRQRFAIIGSGVLVPRLEEALNIDEFSRYEVADVLPSKQESLTKLEQLLERNEIDDVVIVQDSPKVFNEVVYLCEKYGCRVRAVPFYVDALSTSTRVEQLGDMKLLNFRVCPLDSLSNAMVKRSFDFCSAILLLILFSPFMLVAAIGTKISSPGPILFKQERVGQYRKLFTMLKFRSMRITGTEKTGWSTDEDPRKTKFGSLIRKTSIDELPQLFNVLQGNMSLIGPRPEVPYHVDHFKDEIPHYLVRQQVKPGITGWAQVNGLRGDTDIAERVKYDVWYIENWSLSLDIKIVIKTIFGGMLNSEHIK